jgi:UDP-2,3-diacylglucosamine pyrophosphatase LpxH
MNHTLNAGRRQSLFVISDLHLGGAPVDLELCTASARERLAEYIRYVAGLRTEAHDVHLVINGDIVDFLGEPDAVPFIKEDGAALRAFEGIVSRTKEVWDALRDLTKSGCALTLLLGNHDLELSLPGPRRLLLETLGPGRVEFIYDNQALVVGPALIEHGARFDAWNQPPHDKLRRVRAKLSRGERAEKYPKIPGSELVCRVINKVKAEYRFVDLLKPETHAVLPLLPILDPSLKGVLDRIVQRFKAAQPYVRMKRSRIDERGRPRDPEYTATASRRLSRSAQKADEALRLGLAALEEDPEQASFADRVIDSLIDTWASATAHRKDRLKQSLYDQWRYLAQEFCFAYAFDQEDDTYLRPARNAATGRCRVVVYGHTHLAKRAPLPNGAWYLNTGTWMDVIRVPDVILTSKKELAWATFEQFIDDIVNNRLKAWRRLRPTFARIDVDDKGGLEHADVYLFLGETPEGKPRLARLEEWEGETSS